MAGNRWIGYLGWAVLFAAFFAWEGVGLRRSGDAFPTLSDAVHAIMRSPVGRWALFALWLWFGWHAFVRGWHFLLRGPEGEPSAQPGPPPGSPFRQDVLPMLVGYMVVMATLALGWRKRNQRAEIQPGGGWPALIRRFAVTAVGGYALLMAIVVAYSLAVPGGHYLASAFTGGAMLMAVSVPVFALASWLERGRRMSTRFHS